jgi:hypothetical protein
MKGIAKDADSRKLWYRRHVALHSRGAAFRVRFTELVALDPEGAGLVLEQARPAQRSHLRPDDLIPLMASGTPRARERALTAVHELTVTPLGWRLGGSGIAASQAVAG